MAKLFNLWTSIKRIPLYSTETYRIIPIDKNCVSLYLVYIWIAAWKTWLFMKISNNVHVYVNHHIYLQQWWVNFNHDFRISEREKRDYVALLANFPVISAFLGLDAHTFLTFSFVLIDFHPLLFYDNDCIICISFFCKTWKNI